MTILNKLTSYYLECLSHDDEGGISVFAYDKYGNPDYVQLTELPQLSEQPNELFNNEPTRKLLYKIRRDKSRLTLYLGYPIRLRKIRSKKSSWEGFKVEPLFLFPVDYNPGARDSIPQVNPEPPRFNFAALKGLVEEGSGHLLEEVVLLTEALGMDNGFQNMPELDEICSRLQELRSEWNWQEDLMPPNLALEPAISDITTEGFYNRAILVVGERSQFTQGLETELSKLSKINGHDLKDTALGYWLGLSDSDQAEHDDIPPLEVVELNEEQRQAVMRGTVSPLTVITGPPGTGKSQVVTTLLVNAAWRNMRVLFASKNNKAVDVVETRTNGLSNRPILLRLGRSEFQSRLADHLSDLLATQNTGDDERKFQEAKDKYEQLIAKEKQVKAKLEKIVELRNQVDSLEQKVESHRDLFGKEFFAKYLDSTPESISEVAEKFQSALAACYRQNNSFITRLFWHVLKNSKLQELSNIARSTERPATELGLKTPSLEVSESNLQVWIQYGTELNARLKAANEIYTYAMALAELQSIESPEILARESLELARHIADCSQEVWASWLNLQPKRLSQADRKLLGEYASVLSMIVNANKSSQRLSAGIFRQYYQLFPKVSHLLPCWAVTSLSAHNKVPFEPGFFDLVVIDEASQCDIASALPLLYRAKRAVIIGDPKQLQHISSISEQQDMQLLAKYGLSDGFVSWAYSVNSLYSLAQSLCASEAIVNLRDHHRSHEDIINFSNKHFYKGNLRVATRYDKLKRLKDHLPAVRWKDVIGRVTRPASGGAFNDAEAKAVVDMLDDLVITKQYNGSVGVVTPFRAQANRIRDLVYQRSNLSTRLVSLEFLVDTVHKFQGDERDLMIFSPVVSKGISDGATRFLNRNGNLFNVAITRARSLLLVVGDRNAIL
ncbi:MAG: ATP-binding protein, partial [Actinobacteria bacterium]|nr:ATP-binding protein [Actinomycetota bacterium]